MPVFADLLALSDRDDDCFEAPCAPEAGERTFGGQFMAHAIAAAYRTVGDDRFVHSLHGYFLSAGDVTRPTFLRVERVRDGRSFSVRHVSAFQVIEGGVEQERFRAVMSFHVPEDGPVFEGSAMPNVPGPDQVTVTYDEFTHQFRAPGLSDSERWAGEQRPMDILYVNPPAAPPGEPVLEPQQMWMRINEVMADDRIAHDCGLVYLSDSTLVDHVWLPHGHRWQDPDSIGASLDHAMWFHAPWFQLGVRADQWLFFDQTVEATGGSRGLASGRFYTETGVLVATCSQEGLMRRSSP